MNVHGYELCTSELVYFSFFFLVSCLSSFSFFFFFNDTATTEIYTLSLHDALPISCRIHARASRGGVRSGTVRPGHRAPRDRKSTRLNSSHLVISYAVFCLKKKKQKTQSAPTLAPNEINHDQHQ